MNDNLLQKTATKTAVLETEIVSHQQLMQRLVRTQDSIGSVLIELREMSAEHRSRITHNEQALDLYMEDAKTRRNETHQMIKDLRDEIKEDIQQQTLNHKELKDEIKAINKWRWGLAGGTTVLGVMIGIYLKITGLV